MENKEDEQMGQKESAPNLQPSNSSSTKSKSLYTSPPFRFIVEGTTFYLDAALVSQYSKPLDRMMNGAMSEAQKGVATIEEVDEGTFGRFGEWVNQGRYTPGEVVTRPPTGTRTEASNDEDGEAHKPEQSAPGPPENDEELLNPTPAIVGWGAPTRAIVGWGADEPSDFGHAAPSRSSKSKRIKKPIAVSDAASRTQLKESFVRRKGIVQQEISSPQPNQSPEEDYTNVFLSHARLYVFAEKYDVQALRMLALENLQTILAIFTLYEERTRDVIALLRYVYSNTGESIDGVEDLRTLLRHYLGFEMDTLMKDEEFRDLMIEDGGALLGDFMKMVMKRIV